jgi:hypothetical protein
VTLLTLLNRPSNHASVPEMVGHLRQARDSLCAARKCEARDVHGPLITVLVGAGFSVSAGLPSTAHLTDHPLTSGGLSILS